MTGVFGVAGIPAGVEGGFGMLSSLPNAVGIAVEGAQSTRPATRGGRVVVPVFAHEVNVGSRVFIYLTLDTRPQFLGYTQPHVTIRSVQ
jgi:hypothetical protein